MKKIHVITRHAIVNYGSLLQAYATQKVLESMGYNVDIIDYVPFEETVCRRINNFAMKHQNALKRYIYKIVKFPDELYKEVVFAQYRKKTLVLTKKFSSQDELQEYNWGEDYLCAGSDQLWGYVYNGKIDPTYFLGFGTDKNRYFSYSSSFGRTDFEEKYLLDLNSYLEKFSFITVRKASGVALIHEATSLNAHEVLDPTLLLSSDAWNKWASSRGGSKKEPYILLYQLRRNKKLDVYVKELSKQLGIKIVRVSTSLYDYMRFGKKKILRSPQQVLALFRGASYIITDSFHATVFSLVFNRKFMVYLPPETHNRITDLLAVVGLNDRIIEDINENSIALADELINYDKVNEILRCQREKDLHLISDLLKKINE